MTNNIQKVIERLGKSGCYFLSLLSVAEEVTKKHIDIVLSAEYCLSKKYVNADFYVNYPALVLEAVTKKKWTVRHERYPYVPKENEFVITRYELQTTLKTLAHFERDTFEPILNDVVSTKGKPVSTRVCTLLN